MKENEDKKGVLQRGVFDYKVTKDKKVLISWNNKQVVILSGENAEKFISKIQNASDYEKQMVMAKMTGNFKHGNEKANKR